MSNLHLLEDLMFVVQGDFAAMLLTVSLAAPAGHFYLITGTTILLWLHIVPPVTLAGAILLQTRARLRLVGLVQTTGPRLRLWPNMSQFTKKHLSASVIVLAIFFNAMGTWNIMLLFNILPCFLLAGSPSGYQCTHTDVTCRNNKKYADIPVIGDTKKQSRASHLINNTLYFHSVAIIATLTKSNIRAEALFHLILSSNIYLSLYHWGKWRQEQR